MSATRCSERACAGFTLLELLLAITIFAIFATAIYGVLARTLEGKERAEAKAELFAAGRDAVMRIADDLERALPPLPGNRNQVWLIGVPGNDAVPTDQIGFVMDVRRERSATGRRGGRVFVSYLLEPMPDIPRAFALLRHEELLLDPLAQAMAEGEAGAENQDTSLVNEVYLVDRVAGLRFRYLDPASGEWVNAWDTTAAVQPGEAPVPLPPVVEVQLFLLDDTGGYVDFSTRVDLPLYSPPPTPAPGGVRAPLG